MPTTAEQRNVDMHLSKASFKLVIATAILSLLTVGSAVAEMPDGATEDQQALYALGVAISKQVAGFSLSAEELNMVITGLKDGHAGNEGDINLQELMGKLNQLAKTRAEAASKVEREAATAFLTKKGDEAKAKGGEVTSSGLIFTELKAGDGASPNATDKVKVHYHGTLRTGEVFDSSRDRGQPASFGLNQVIPCWTEGVQKMKVGGKAELVCPPDIAYGDRAAGKIPPGSALVFEVELLEIDKPQG